MSVPAGPEVPMQTPMLPALARRVAVGHVRGALDMAGQDMADAAMRAHRRVEWVDGCAGNAEADR